MSNDNTPIVPIADELKVRLAKFLMDLTNELGGDAAALATALAQLNTTEDLIPVYRAAVSAPIFRRVLETDGGEQVPVIHMRMAPQVMPYKGKDQVAVMILDFIVADPGIGRQVLARVVVTADDLHVVAPGISLNDTDDSQSDYHSGAMQQLGALSETVRAFIYHLLRTPSFAKGSAADAMRDEALNDLGYINPMSFPLSGRVMDDLARLFAAVDGAMGLKPESGLEATLNARLANLQSGTFLTGQDIANIIEPLRRYGVRLAVRAKEGEVAGLGLEVQLADATGKALVSVLIGVGLDGDASLVSSAFAVHVQGSKSHVDGAALMALRKAPEGTPPEHQKMLLGVILRLVQSFASFTKDDAVAEQARRQIAQALSLPQFDDVPSDDD